MAEFQFRKWVFLNLKIVDMKKIFSAFALSITLLLCGCNQSVGETHLEYDPMIALPENYFTYSGQDLGDGYYFWDGTCRYLDYGTMTVVPICSRLNCTHMGNDRNDCSGRKMGDNRWIFYNNSVYYIENECTDENKMEYSAYLCRAELDGTNRRRITKLGDYQCTAMFVSDDIAYIMAARTYFPEGDDPEELHYYYNQQVYVLALDLKTFDTRFSHCLFEGISPDIRIKGMVDGNIYLNISAIDEEIFSVTEFCDQNVNISNRIFTVNTKSLEIGEYTDHYPVSIYGNKYLMYQNNGNLCFESADNTIIIPSFDFAGSSSVFSVSYNDERLIICSSADPDMLYLFNMKTQKLLKGDIEQFKAELVGKEFFFVAEYENSLILKAIGDCNFFKVPLDKIVFTDAEFDEL